jgi:hypothetical protein
MNPRASAALTVGWPASREYQTIREFAREILQSI